MKRSEFFGRMAATLYAAVSAPAILAIAPKPEATISDQQAEDYIADAVAEMEKSVTPFSGRDERAAILSSVRPVFRNVSCVGCGGHIGHFRAAGFEYGYATRFDMNSRRIVCDRCRTPVLDSLREEEGA